MPRNPYYVHLQLPREVTETGGRLSFFRRKEEISLGHLLLLLRAIRKNDAVRVLLLEIGPMGIGWGQIEEIQLELDALREAGIRTICFMRSGDNRSYYLASACDEILLLPSSSLELVGLRAEVYFFSSLLDYLGVQPQLFNVGAYKSAHETFTRTSMSAESREDSARLLQDLQDRILDRVAARKQVSRGIVQEWIDQGPYIATKALESGLVDRLCYPDELEEHVRERAPGIRKLPLKKLRVREGLLRRALGVFRPSVALIIAEGIIAPGSSRRSFGRWPILGSETLIELLRAARKRKRTKAVVVRIDSPGGSALESDRIWREILLTDQQKPVVISFGNVAASGGYYIAAGGRRIVASAASITGSIGVIGGKFSMAELLQRLGIAVDTIELGARSGMSSATRPYTEEEAESVKESLRFFYEDLFLKKAAEARKMELDEMRPLAEGRVWSGGRAMKSGLVDEIGNVLSAVDLAKRLAGLEGKRVRLLTRTAPGRLGGLLSLPGLLRERSALELPTVPFAGAGGDALRRFALNARAESRMSELLALDLRDLRIY